MKFRESPENNYKAVFLNGKTFRSQIDPSKPITELYYPEFLDIGINTKCAGGCPYCYTSATASGYNFTNIINKAHRFFGGMDENQRPFQVAIGGSGEATLHPDFIEFCKVIKSYDVVPNYTTNGMHLSKKILEATKEYCGGVAITLHRHLEKFWRKAIEDCIEYKIKLNFHLIISDQESIDFLKSINEQYSKNDVDYMVLLPYKNVGFAENCKKEIDYEYLFEYLNNLEDNSNIAYGAYFYEFLKKRSRGWNVSLYEPEIMSKYILFTDDMPIYNNSFDCKLVRNGI